MKKYDEFVSINEFKLDTPKLKVSVSDAGEKIKDGVNNFLEISKEKVNDPESKEKVKGFLLKLEKLSIDIKKTLKSRKGQDRALLMTTIGVYSSLVAGIWGAIFHSGAEEWYKPWTFELGGTFFIKLAVFFWLIKLVITAYKNMSEFTSMLSSIKSFFSRIIGLFKSNKSEDDIVESVNFLFEEIIKEDATATAGNTNGMGAVSAATPSSTPGDTAGSTIGSGDIGQAFGTYTKPKLKRKKKKKSKKHVETFDNFDPMKKEELDNYTARFYDNFDDEKEKHHEENSRFELFEDFETKMTYEMSGSPKPYFKTKTEFVAAM